MATTKKLPYVLLDGPVCTPSLNALLIRRKSITPLRTSPPILSENNDEAERLARRQEIHSSNSTPIIVPPGSDRRRSLGLAFLTHMPAPQIADRISQCIKLSAENKINAKNAFSLEIIDFMTYMIKKQDANMSNLQIASTSLDVSTKIYGYRVDGVHTQILKMIGGLDKQDKGDETSSNDMDRLPNASDIGEESVKSRVKKKKSDNKRRLFSSVEALRGNIEIAQPTTMLFGDADLQTTDTLCQVMFPNHANSGFYQHLHNDVLVDTVEETDTQMNEARCTIPPIGDFSHCELCPALSAFEFQGWTAENVPDGGPPEKNQENRFEFDLDASLPADDGPEHDSGLYFHSEDLVREAVGCVRAPHEVEKVVDFRNAVASGPVKISEYSFAKTNFNIHWAGPSHWKVGNFMRQLGNNKTVATCQQGPAKKRKEIELSYNREIRDRTAKKYEPGVSVRLHAKTAKEGWNEEDLSLPRDVHYDIASARGLYLHTLIANYGNKDQLKDTHLFDDIENYDYNNENDTSNYCPDVTHADFGEKESPKGDNEDGSRTDNIGPGGQNTFTGDNLVTAPKLTNKIAIAYSMRAKKIDMGQLKRSIWKSLITSGDKENLVTKETVEQESANKMKQEKRFSEVYKALPNTLTKGNVEALSFPISFVSLLHLANEKTLKLNTLPDMSDIIVNGN